MNRHMLSTDLSDSGTVALRCSQVRDVKAGVGVWALLIRGPTDVAGMGLLLTLGDNEKA